MLTLTNRFGQWTLLLILAFPIVIGASQLHADESLVHDYDSRLALLEAELHSLRCRIGNRCNENPSCKSRCDDHHAYAGAGLVFARPHFKESFQYSQVDTSSGQQTLHPFSFDYDITPRVWLGIRTPSDLGVHVDYWQYHHSSDRAIAIADGTNIYSSNATTVIFPATILADDPGEILTADSSLETQILNLMGTMHGRFQSMRVRAGVGLRYVLLDQELATSVVDGFGVPQGILNWSRRFEGLGPAATMEMRRPIGNSGLSIVAGGGGSFLFGTKKLDRFVVGDIGTPPAPPFLRLDDADEVVGVGELNLGLEWARRFCNGSELAVQGRYEGQLWAEAGAPTLGFLGFEGFGVFAELRR